MFSETTERPDWRFSLRLAIGVGGLFAVAVIALYFSSGKLLERALTQEEAALVLDRREDVRVAWQDAGDAGLADLFKDIETATGEQLAVRIEAVDQAVVFDGATAKTPEAPWGRLRSSFVGEKRNVVATEGWTATFIALGSGETAWVARYSSVVSEVQSKYRGLFLTAVGPLVLAGVAGAVLLVIVSLRPLRRTVVVMRHIVRTGDWGARVTPPRATGEMRNLAEAFNAVLERQQHLVDRLRQSLDYVAHDLRTPLTRLQMAVESGLEKTEPGSAARSAFGDCLEESQRVQSTLDTLLDVAEAEAGAMRLKLARIDAADLLGEVGELYEFLAEEKGAKLEVQAVKGLVFMGDPVRLRRALANLVDNALKYLGSGGLVLLSAELAGENILFQVRDDGVGIALEDLGRIWDRLYRVERSRSSPGMGLGLSLVKAIAEAHGGRADVSSTIGKGSVFQLRLPRNIS